MLRLSLAPTGPTTSFCSLVIVSIQVVQLEVEVHDLFNWRCRLPVEHLAVAHGDVLVVSAHHPHCLPLGGLPVPDTIWDPYSFKVDYKLVYHICIIYHKCIIQFHTTRKVLYHLCIRQAKKGKSPALGCCCSSNFCLLGCCCSLGCSFSFVCSTKKYKSFHMSQRDNKVIIICQKQNYLGHWGVLLVNLQQRKHKTQ